MKNRFLILLLALPFILAVAVAAFSRSSRRTAAWLAAAAPLACAVCNVMAAVL